MRNAELFASLDVFKSHIGGAVNTTLELRSIAPVVYDTARRHLVPYLGNAFYTSMVTAYDGVDDADAETLAAIEKVQRSLALLTMYEYGKIAGVQFGESGIHRVETETRKSAYRYQEKEYSNYMLEKGYDALEELLLFLTNNQDDYPEWRDSKEAKTHTAPLLNYANDFRRLLYVSCDRYTFEALRPIIAQMEQFIIKKILPKAYYTEIKERYTANDLSDPDMAIIDLMRLAIGHKAYDEAQVRHLIQVKAGRVYVVEEFGEQSSINKTMPNQVLNGLSADEIWSNRYVGALRTYLVENASDYPTLFDAASGGINTDADAWHIDTEEEAKAKVTKQDCDQRQSAVYRF